MPPKILILHAAKTPLLLVLFLHLALCATATPLPASLAARRDFCSNAPGTIAGTALPPRRPADTIIWCTPGSSTFIRMRRLAPMVNPPGPNLAISGMLTTAHAIAMMNAHLHDGVIPVAQAVGGVWQWNVHQGLALQTWNANNHQMTWGVLAAAFLALLQYMEGSGYGAVTFDVWDGDNWVGSGRLS